MVQRTRLSLLLFACAFVIGPAAGALPIGSLVISEVMFDPRGGENRKQWVELFNATNGAIDLSTYSLGWGRDDYTNGTLQLSGIVEGGATWVVGGPRSSRDNADPIFDQAVDLNRDLGRGNNRHSADGLALFDVMAANISATLTPIDAVIYGRGSASRPSRSGRCCGPAATPRRRDAGSWR